MFVLTFVENIFKS